jgi:hypothetical protein
MGYTVLVDAAFWLDIRPGCRQVLRAVLWVHGIITLTPPNSAVFPAYSRNKHGAKFFPVIFIVLGLNQQLKLRENFLLVGPKKTVLVRHVPAPNSDFFLIWFNSLPRYNI